MTQITVMITSVAVDDMERHMCYVDEINSILGTTEQGANGGFGDYWTHGETVYDLAQNPKLARYVKLLGPEVAQLGFYFIDGLATCIKPTDGMWAYPEGAHLMQVDFTF